MPNGAPSGRTAGEGCLFKGDRMITFTDAARDVIVSLMEEVENSCLRLAVAGGSPLAPDFDFSLVDEASREEADEVLDAGGFTVLVDPESAPRVRGMTVDYVVRNGASGFELRAPRIGAEDVPQGPVAEQVQRVIAERINPGIASHGGEIVLRDVRDGVVFIEMSGGCQGCAMSRMTLRQGVERMIKEAVPEVVAIQDVTDHAAGSNPFYSS